MANTSLTAQQISDLRLAFDFIDTDKSGTIEWGELYDVVKRCDPLLPLREEEARDFFIKMNKSGNQRVSFDEFASFLAKYVPPSLTVAPASSPKPLPPNIDTSDIPHLNQWIKCEDFPNPIQKNPIQFHSKNFVANNERVKEAEIVEGNQANASPKQFVRAGPRQTIVFDSSKVKAAIITCGGLCPGLNTVIRELVFCLTYTYQVSEIFGIQYGYRGFYAYDMIKLTPKSVSGIHNKGGTILGSSRGGFNIKKIGDAIEKHKIDQLYIIGGDGTHRGAQVIMEEVRKRKLKVAIGCIPKTIDNDFQLIDRSFGFLTSVDEAQNAIKSAKVEAEGSVNGIGLVKLMGRQSGFIATLASLASRDVDYCLIPEVPFTLVSLLRHIKRSLRDKGHVVIVVAEGAGGHLLQSTGQKDLSGNPVLPDIGKFLKTEISSFFAQEKMEVSVKYIDPTYMIRSIPPNAYDSIYCSVLAHNAVHGAMAGYTGFTVGLINNHYVYLPDRKSVV